MEIHFHNVYDNALVLNKKLNDPIIINGTLKEGAGVLNPAIMCEFNLGVSPDVNYAYIPSFKRYYFVGEPRNVKRNIWVFPFSVDPLMSHKSDILATPIIASRSASLFDPYLPDTMVKDTTQVNIYTRAWGGGSFTPTAGTYVLAVNGI